MAKTAKNILVIVGGYNLSCYLRDVKISHDVEMKDNTALCTTGAKTFLPGLRDVKLSAEGFWDADDFPDTGQNIDELFTAALGDSVPTYWMVGKEEFAVGGPVDILENVESKYEVSEKVGDLIMATVDGVANASESVYSQLRGQWLINSSINEATDLVFDLGSASLKGIVTQTAITNNDDNCQVAFAHSTLPSGPWIVLGDSEVSANTSERQVFTGMVARYLQIAVKPLANFNTVVSAVAKIS